MCFAEIAMVASAAGTVYGMQAQQSYYDYQAQVQEKNAAISNKQAEIAAEQGAIEQGNIKKNTAQVIGAQKAGFSANNLDISAGSPMDVLTNTAYLGSIDVATSRYNTANKVWAYQEQAKGYSENANAFRMMGDYASTSTLLTGMGSLANQYSVFSGGKKKAATVPSYGSSGGYTTGKLYPLAGIGGE